MQHKIKHSGCEEGSKKVYKKMHVPLDVGEMHEIGYGVNSIPLEEIRVNPNLNPLLSPM